MTPTLVFQEGPLAGRRIELDGELIVGREDASLTIEDPEISRKHAAIRPVDGGFEIEDLGSRNGTHVNGSRIEGATRLGGGDSIKLGQSVIAFEAARGAETVASPVQAPPAPAAAAAPEAPAPSRAAPRSAPREPFGTYAAPASSKRRSGIASRQLAPQLLTFAAVGATAVALVVYFAQH
jgi:pSer/pThr/pTyr-binding forkhead associated (FHA) protein